MENKCRLVEMEETENGYTINNLTPFYIHSHIKELLDKAKTGLQIYRDLQRIATIENTDKIISIISSANCVEDAKQELVEQFSISECTAVNLLDTPLEELSLFGAYTYDESIKIYEETVKSLTRVYDLQVAFDNIGKTDE